MSTQSRVLDALGTVYDPELDEPITQLRFVSVCEVSEDGEVEVRLRLPTPQCAPNFAFLMAADARSAVRRVDGVTHVSIVLEDHYTGDEINDAIAGGDGFTAAFPGETTDDELDALRERFQRKALVARQSQIAQQLLGDGMSGERLTAMTVAELPPGPVAERCLELREQLGFPSGPDDPAFLLADGRPLAAEELTRWLRMARLIRTSLETNGGICRSLLEFRHSLPPDPQEVRS
jgi:metal-sulfur cluster biosynthetic enzyme